jgi:alkylated DNA repair dioxygenase AlkB
MQQQLFDSPTENTSIQLDMPDADVRYYPNFIPARLANTYTASLIRSLAWQQEQITLYGKTFNVPRLQAWYGDENADYQYSNLTMQPIPWNPVLLELKQKCEVVSHTGFNSVLANLYRNGDDSMGRHADNEFELGQRPVIASLSFGESRNLDFYHNKTKQKTRIPLSNGSLLLMQGQTQNGWQHAIAKSKRTLQARVNLTFRFIHKNFSNKS